MGSTTDSMTLPSGVLKRPMQAGDRPFILSTWKHVWLSRPPLCFVDRRAVFKWLNRYCDNCLADMRATVFCSEHDPDFVIAWVVHSDQEVAETYVRPRYQHMPGLLTALVNTPTEDAQWHHNTPQLMGKWSKK